MAKRTSRDWHPEDIKAAIRKRGWTLTGLSLANGLPDHACRHALRKPNFAGELAIAGALGVSPRHIWPSRFNVDGSRRPQRRSRSKSSAPRVAGHCQMHEAA